MKKKIWNWFIYIRFWASDFQGFDKTFWINMRRFQRKKYSSKNIIDSWYPLATSYVFFPNRLTDQISPSARENSDYLSAHLWLSLCTSRQNAAWQYKRTSGILYLPVKWHLISKVLFTYFRFPYLWALGDCFEALTYRLPLWLS